MKSFQLNDGNKIPVLGFGTWQILGEDCTRSVLSALEVGYRHIDTADRYGNHKEIAKAINQANIKREELFITSKVWFDELKHDDLINACHRFLDELQIDYLDLLLIHWPNREIEIKQSVEALVELKQKGIIRSFGVSNCTPHHLQDFIDTGHTPAIDQVELHPSLGQFELNEFCNKNNITLTAYSPLGQGGELDNSTIVEIAQRYSKTPAQVVLNWIIGRGIVTIPKSTHSERIAENFDSIDFNLERADIETINKIDNGNRLIIPEWADFEY